MTWKSLSNKRLCLHTNFSSPGWSRLHTESLIFPKASHDQNLSLQIKVSDNPPARERSNCISRMKIYTTTANKLCLTLSFLRRKGINRAWKVSAFLVLRGEEGEAVHALLIHHRTSVRSLRFILEIKSSVFSSAAGNPGTNSVQFSPVQFNLANSTSISANIVSDFILIAKKEKKSIPECIQMQMQLGAGNKHGEKYMQTENLLW